VKNYLNNFAYLICFSAIFLFLSGCAPWIPVPVVTTNYQLDGQREIKQSDHVVILGAGKEPKTYGANYTPRSFGDEPANCFILSIRSGKSSITLESVQGSYQYYSENPQPLELTWMAHGEALLFPTANIVGKPLPKRTEKSGEMKHGRYKIDITYRLNGLDYQCHFDVVYKTKNETGIVGPWSGKDIH
jgi:hypothetical protein